MASSRITVVIKIKVTSELFRVYIDGRRILFKNSSAKLRFVPQSGEHALMWFIRDKPGTSYRIEITEPARVKMSHKAVLDSSAMDAGIFWFKL